MEAKVKYNIIMKNLTQEFNYIFKQTIDYYVNRKKFMENIGSVEVVPVKITKNEITRAYFASIYTFIITLQCNELYIHDEVILSDSVEQSATQLFNEKLYPYIEAYLENNGVTVIK